MLFITLPTVLPSAWLVSYPPALGLVTTLAVLVHEIPQELSDFTILAVERIFPVAGVLGQYPVWYGDPRRGGVGVWGLGLCGADRALCPDVGRRQFFCISVLPIWFPTYMADTGRPVGLGRLP